MLPRTLKSLIFATAFIGFSAVGQLAMAAGKPIVHDSEYYILNAQHGEKWAVEDKELDAKLAELRKKFGAPLNIMQILFDDTPVGASRSPCWGSRMHPTCKPH